MVVTDLWRLVLGSRRNVVEHPGAARHRLDLAVALVDDRDFHDGMLRLAKVVDDDVHEPGTQGAVLLGVVRLLVLHRSLLVLPVTISKFPHSQISKFPNPTRPLRARAPPRVPARRGPLR